MSPYSKAIIAMNCAIAIGAGAAPSARIAKWRNDAKSATSLYYDDGTDSAFQYVCGALVRRAIPGTFYIISGRSDTEISPNTPRWKEVARNNRGIIFLGDHTWLHGNTTNVAQFAREIERNGRLLREYAGLPEHALLSYARPGGVRWEITDEEEKAVLDAHNELRRGSFGQCIAGPEDWRMNTAAKAAAFLDIAEKNGDWQPLLFHGVGSDWFNFPASEHELLLAELDRRRADGRIWPGAAIEVQKYMAERDGASLVCAECDPDGPMLLSAKLSMSTDPALYDTPLTIVIENLPESLDSVVISILREGFTEKIRAAVSNGKAIFEIKPTAGETEIRIAKVIAP